MSKFTSQLLIGSLLMMGLMLGLKYVSQPIVASQPLQELRTNIQAEIPENRGEIVTNFLATNAGTLIQSATNQNQGDLLNNLEFPLLQTVRSLLPVVLVGSQVSLEQPTNNMVIIAAQNAEINAEVGGEVYALAITLNINAPVAGKVTAVTTQLKSNSPITLEMMSPFAVGRLLWQEIDARRPVNTGVATASGTLETEPATDGAQLESSLLVPSGIAGIAQIPKWNLHIVKPAMAQENEVDSTSSMTEPAMSAIEINWDAVASTTQSGLATIISLWLLVFFAPRLISETTDSILGKPFNNVLWGIIGLIVIPILAVILLFTKIGLSVSLILFFLYGVALLLSTWLVAFAIGKWTATALVKRQPKNKWLMSPYVWAVLGGVILVLLTNLPWVGGIVVLLSFVTGFGALMLWMGNLRTPVAKKL